MNEFSARERCQLRPNWGGHELIYGHAPILMACIFNIQIYPHVIFALETAKEELEVHREACFR